MKLWQRDVLLMWRKPSYWLVMAVLAFLLGWIALVMTDLALGQAAEKSAIVQTSLMRQLVAPFFVFASLLSLALMSLLAGQLLAAERAEGTIMYLLESGLGDVRVMAHKLLALLLLVLPVLLPVLMALWGWSLAGSLDMTLLAWQFLAWGLLLLWFASLSLWLSVNMTQPGLAALLGLVIVTLLWLMGQAGNNDGWGKNWIRAFSPRSHFEWVQNGLLPYASLVFFVGGAVVLFGLAVFSLKRLRLS